MSKIFITGIAGFIGFHTAKKLRALGHEVYGCDNFNQYYDPELKHERARRLSLIGVGIWEADICSQNFPDIEADLVIHLAAMAGVRYSMDHPMEYIQNNIVGTQMLIENLERNNVQQVIYASTSCVLHGQELPWREYETLYPQLNPYGYSKMLNESQFNMSKIPQAVGIRFFTVYGPYGRPDMALFDFTRSILADRPITLFNYGDMKRDFTYVDDIVQGVVLVSENMTDRDIYNLGNGKQVELKEFVEAIELALGKRAIVEYGPKHPADAKETWSDTSKIAKLGYKSTTPVEEGVKKFVDWYKKYYNWID